MTQLAEHVFNVMTNEGGFYYPHIDQTIKNVRFWSLTRAAQHREVISTRWKSLANIMLRLCTKYRPDEFRSKLDFTIEDRDALAQMLAENYNGDIMEGGK